MADTADNIVKTIDQDQENASAIHLRAKSHPIAPSRPPSSRYSMTSSEPPCCQSAPHHDSIPKAPMRHGELSTKSLDFASARHGLEPGFWFVYTNLVLISLLVDPSVHQNMHESRPAFPKSKRTALHMVEPISYLPPQSPIPIASNEHMFLLRYHGPSYPPLVLDLSRFFVPQISFRPSMAHHSFSEAMRGRELMSKTYLNKSALYKHGPSPDCSSFVVALLHSKMPQKRKAKDDQDDASTGKTEAKAASAVPSKRAKVQPRKASKSKGKRTSKRGHKATVETEDEAETSVDESEPTLSASDGVESGAEDDEEIVQPKPSKKGRNDQPQARRGQRRSARNTTRNRRKTSQKEPAPEEESERDTNAGDSGGEAEDTEADIEEQTPERPSSPASVMSFDSDLTPVPATAKPGPLSKKTPYVDLPSRKSHAGTPARVLEIAQVFNPSGAPSASSRGTFEIRSNLPASSPALSHVSRTATPSLPPGKIPKAEHRVLQRPKQAAPPVAIGSTKFSLEWGNEEGDWAMAPAIPALDPVTNQRIEFPTCDRTVYPASRIPDKPTWFMICAGENNFTSVYGQAEPSKTGISGPYNPYAASFNYAKNRWETIPEGFVIPCPTVLPSLVPLYFLP
ncbi:hypothetical protein BKA70DRAFT_1444313 [Coprinopsis sp. MPI-PUGE-AT-0042]|nr:hypothetical protein BKA70DRAFT_1444313 [Coprinopsis sp. MPI-PUGE-AT-0042]